MNMKEYNAWMEETKKSESDWVLDDITWYNKHEVFMYIGGEDGKFVSIDKDGLMALGSYKGAVPHIGEAIFTIEAKKKYKDQNEAAEKAITLGGMQFLISLFSSF